MPHAGEEELQLLVRQVTGFLLQGIPSSNSFAAPTHNMAAGTAYGLLAECAHQGCPIATSVALWGPSLCR